MVLLMWNPMWSHYMMYPYTWQSGYAVSISYDDNFLSHRGVFHYFPLPSPC